MANGLIRRVSLSTLSLAVLAACAAPEFDRARLEAEARDISGQFTATLLPTLQQALADGGPENAIEVCAVRAPEIAEELAEATSWSVRRVSLKARNSALAVPDDWEREVLMQFDERRQAGEEGASLNLAAAVDGEFRYMQAQIAMPLCLTCHGADISPTVSAALREHYPDDLATGYSAGDVRGAISLSYTVE